ncbi:MAG: 3-methyl-2-oxobutanoate hydroxymethyltransferase [Alphaproteobacteria bacterium]|nr:3-methyl-2-oxobutanoate hydroxymethyltransferase [Alphaproteobacteria bacterium]NNF24887.1 3-methyl-2-oxobutanoate hydroxymethyltransferase [Paracoccaceae bacterium]RZV99291.1 MAG: 3-methyl-2-oxobutanoate hydroxymethyltransferase [Paracoccaceae bacterium]
MTRVTIPALHDKKRNAEKIFGVVAWDTHMAAIADRVGVDIVSVGDTVGKNLWGHDTMFEITMDEMIVVTKAVRRGVRTALVSADFPYGPLQEGVDAAVHAGIRLIKEAGIDLLKLDGAADYPETVTALTRAGIPVWAQFGLTPQTALATGIPYENQAGATEAAPGMEERLIAQARALADAGAVLLDFTNSGPIIGPKVVAAVDIPVIGGFGGGPWLDGRVRLAQAAVGYNVSALDKEPGGYANVATVIRDALAECADDVRSGRQIKGQPGR